MKIVNVRNKLLSAVTKTVSRRFQLHRNSLPASTTSAQLRAASTRGSILASEEYEDVARAQRDRNAIHYHAVAAVQIGNDLAALRHERSGSTSAIVPPLPVLDSGSIVNKSMRGSKTKTPPWDAMQSVTRSSFRTSGEIKQGVSNLE